MFESFVAYAGVISDATPLSEVLVNILQFLLSVVGIVAILSIVIVGLRYLLATNVDQAGGAKKSLGAIVLGLVLVMGTLIIVSTVGKFLQ